MKVKILMIICFLLIIAIIAGCSGGNPNADQFTVTVTCEGLGKVSDESGYPVTTRKVSNGTVITLIPQGEKNTSWVFNHWAGVNGTEITPDNKITINSDKNIIAVFSRQPYNINITVVGQGTVSQQLIFGALDLTTFKGDKIRLVPVAGIGYGFDHWEGDLSSYDFTPEIVLDSNKTITAVFTQTVDYLDFIDEMEGQSSLMRPSGTWSKITSQYHSFNHSWGIDARNTEVSLTSRAIDLSGSQNPYLSFWQLSNSSIAYGDYSQTLEISKDGGNTWSILSGYNISLIYSWSKVIVDLTGYETENNVFFRYHFKNLRNNNNTYWYIDDIRIQEPQLIPNCFEDADLYSSFLNSDGNWTKTGTTSHSSSNCWTSSSAGGTTITYLTSNAFNLTGSTNPYLIFWHQSHLGSTAFNNCTVEVSTNGTSWTWIESFHVTQSAWKKVMHSLSYWKDYSNVYIRFRFSSDSPLNQDYWHVDDIGVYDIL